MPAKISTDVDIQSKAPNTGKYTVSEGNKQNQEEREILITQQKLGEVSTDYAPVREDFFPV